MNPSASHHGVRSATETVMDADGRRITIRRLDGTRPAPDVQGSRPLLAQNPPWLGMALIASSVTAIDDVPVPSPSNELQIEAMVGRLGDTGVAAIAQALRQISEPTSSELVDNAGN